MNRFIGNTLNILRNLDITGTDLTPDDLNENIVKIEIAGYEYIHNTNRICHIPVYNIIYLVYTLSFIKSVNRYIDYVVIQLNSFHASKNINDIIVKVVEDYTQSVTNNNVIDNCDITPDDDWT